MRITKLALMLLLLAATAQAAPLVLYSPAVVDSVSGDTVQPALAHTVAFDTTTAADTAGWSVRTYLKINRWPDSVVVRLFGIGEGMLWAELALFTPDSVEGLEGYRPVWWSGSTVMEDSVIAPGRYRVSGDSLLE